MHDTNSEVAFVTSQHLAVFDHLLLCVIELDDVVEVCAQGAERLTSGRANCLPIDKRGDVIIRRRFVDGFVCNTERLL